MTGDGNAMAWRAGAELTMMERTGDWTLGGGFKHTWYGGAADASYENVPLVDASGKRLPWPTQGWPDAGAMRPTPEEMQTLGMARKHLERVALHHDVDSCHAHAAGSRAEDHLAYDAARRIHHPEHRGLI